MLSETRRHERGHAFYPPAAALAVIPSLYATEHIPTESRTVFLHYFVRDCDWWIVELDPDTGLGFGYACLHGDAGNAEWGYVDLTELEALYQPSQLQTDYQSRPTRILPRLIVERDLGWTPRPVHSIGLPGWRATG